MEDGGGSGNPFSSPAPRLRPHVKKLVEQVPTLGSISLAAVQGDQAGLGYGLS